MNTAKILQGITSTQQALVDGVALDLKQLAKFLSAEVRANIKDSDTASESNSPSYHIAKRPRKNSSEVLALINGSSAKQSAESDVDVLLDIAQDYDLEDQCGSPVSENLVVISNKMARNKLNKTSSKRS